MCVCVFFKFFFVLVFFFFRAAETPGLGRSGSDPPPEGGCPRCLHEFSCSGTTQHMGSRPHQRLKYKLPAARCLGMPSHQTRSPATLPS